MDGIRRNMGSSMLTSFWNDPWIVPLLLEILLIYFSISEPKRSNVGDIGTWKDKVMIWYFL